MRPPSGGKIRSSSHRMATMRRGKERPGEDPVQRPAVELDPVDRKGERREDVDVRRVGAEQAGGKWRSASGA